MADININLINRLGKGQKSSGNRNSVAKNSEKVKNSKNTFNLGKYSSDIMGGVSSVRRLAELAHLLVKWVQLEVQ